MASSTTAPEAHQHDFLHSGGAVGWSSGGGSSSPGPPPPTPSNHQSPAGDGDDTGAALSRVLERLLTPPKLSMSRFHDRRPSSSSSSSNHNNKNKQAEAKPIRPPSPPLLSLRGGGDGIVAASRELGFFHLSDHGVPANVPEAAIAEAAKLSQLFFSGDGGAPPPLRVIDPAGGELGGDKLEELVGRLEKVGLELVELLFPGNPFMDGARSPVPPRCLVGVLSSSPAAAGCDVDGEGDEQTAERMEKSGVGVLGSVVPPYVVCLQYETSGMTETPWWVLGGGDSVANSVATRPDSLLVTLGDVADVWSNGMFKKVKGIPLPAPSSGGGVVSVSLLITLPAESVVAPLPLPVGEEDTLLH